MISTAKVAAALVLGFALTAGIGVAMVTPGNGLDDVAPDGEENESVPDLEAPVQELSGESDLFTADDPGAVLVMEGVEEAVAADPSGGIAIGLAARWGFLDNPAVAEFGGHWELLDAASGGFMGHWHVAGKRAYGNMHGGFKAAPDGGHGPFAGKWSSSDGRHGGNLAGEWNRLDRMPGGTLAGRWDFSDGRPGGVLRGQWHATGRGEGEFGGIAINAPTMDMVPWDGFTAARDGGVKLLREVRFEHGGEYRRGGDDLVYRQTDRNKLEWRSSTTVNWDGLIMGLLVPNREVKISFSTDQWSRDFTAGELVGLHIRVPTDRLGHEIELRGFLIPPPRRECGDRGLVKVTMSVRWGYLPIRESPEETDPATESLSREFAAWDGFIQVTRGGVGVRAVMDWEKGGAYEQGNDDFIYPRVNKQTIEWRSSTTDDWDGVAVVMCLPLVRGMPAPHVTIHTDLWSHVYDLGDLKGLNERYKVDDAGHEVEVVARLG